MRGYSYLLGYLLCYLLLTSDCLASVQVRLVNGTAVQGGVQVYYQDEWGTVCDDRWDLNDAAVVCRQLGYTSATHFHVNAFFGEGTGPIFLDNVECLGNESSIDECHHNGWLVNDCGHIEDAGVTCDGIVAIPIPSALLVRLVGGSTSHEGRVEVYFQLQDEWGTVCDDGWDLDDANVICRQLGYPSASQAWQGAYFGRGSGPILLDNVHCTGDESNMIECNHDGWLHTDCGHGDDAGVSCRGTSSRPNKSTVRLVGGRTDNEGRVEVYYQGHWGTVCDDGWDLDDADVVCRQLGYPSASRARRNAYFGQGSGLILLDEVACTGSESNIEECNHSAWSDENCDHKEDAGVTCDGSLATSGSVRLVGGSTPNEGRVEVNSEGLWGTVCDFGWDRNAANVICRQLGYPSASRAWSSAHFGQGSGPILLDGVDCTGSESDISKCSTMGWSVKTCDHSDDAGVTCDTFLTEPIPSKGLSPIAIVTIVGVFSSAFIAIVAIYLVNARRKCKKQPRTSDWTCQSPEPSAPSMPVVRPSTPLK